MLRFDDREKNHFFLRLLSKKHTAPYPDTDNLLFGRYDLVRFTCARAIGNF